MNLQRFSQMLDAYGADPRRWSEDERAAALDFMQHSEKARVLQQQALRLDQLLAVLPEVSASATLEQRIFNSIQNPVSEPFFCSNGLRSGQLHYKCWQCRPR